MTSDEYRSVHLIHHSWFAIRHSSFAINMSVTRIATRYAKSLMELAMEQGKLSQVSADVISLAEAARNRDLYMMLKSPIIHGDKKISVLDAIFKSRFDVMTMA